MKYVPTEDVLSSEYEDIGYLIVIHTERTP